MSVADNGWTRVEELYHAALERAPEERALFLSEACAGEPELRREVESLLEHQSGADWLLETPAWPGATPSGSTETSLPAALAAGATLGAYRIVERIGAGGMGEVYKARDTRLRRDVALKILPAATVGNKDWRQHLVREARAASRLNHPHIVTIYDIGEADGIAFIAMECIEGKTLESLISRGGLPVRETLDYAIQIAGALAAAHAAGVVHRDLKPGNIMVTDAGAVKVLDFGLAKQIATPAASPGDSGAADEAKTRTGTVAGTPSFMSPEQAEGRTVDARSDIFSFGGMLYQMLTGKRPFEGGSTLATMAAVLHKEPEPLPASVPAELQKAITRCLRKDPGRRFQHMDDLRVELEELRDELQQEPQAGKPRKGRLRWLAIAALALLAAWSVAAWRLGWLDREPAGPGSLQPMQLTTAPGLAMGASLSPDERAMAFSSDRSGRFEVYVRRAGPKGSERQITSDGQQNIEPSWSPDGTVIAYHSVARHGVWVVPASGGAPRQLTPFGSRPVWSPDGHRLAFRSTEPNDLAWFDWGGAGESTIFTVDADGSHLHQVTTARNPEGQHADPSWSPDGKRLVFASLGPMGARAAINTLWTVDVVSGALQRIPGGNLLGQASPVIAPNGRTVYFSAMAADGFGVYSAPLSGGSPPAALYRTGRDAPAALAISSDGKRLFFTRLVTISQIWQTGANSSPAKALYQDQVVRAKLPTYSPDGRRLAYVVQPQSATQDLWTMNADGSDANAVVADRGFANGPGWTADGGAIWFSFFSPAGFQVRRFNVKDGSQQILLDGKEYFTRVHVTPDQREIVYDSGRPYNIWIRPLAGGAARQLTFDREGAAFPILSRDGQWIAYELYRGEAAELAVMERGGANQQVIAGGPEVHYAFSFASDNRRIAYTSCPGGVWNVYWVDRISRKIEQVTHYTAFGSVVRSPAWRPGTEQMAFEFTEVKGNVHSMALP